MNLSAIANVLANDLDSIQKYRQSPESNKWVIILQSNDAFMFSQRDGKRGMHQQTECVEFSEASKYNTSSEARAVANRVGPNCRVINLRDRLFSEEQRVKALIDKINSGEVS